MSDILSSETKHFKDELILSLKKQRVLKSSIVEKALRAIKREDFLWPGDPGYLAYIDEPRMIGNTGQTISAPHMVVIMLEELELKEGLKVLEIGTGSGYNAALMGWIVSHGATQVSEPLVVSVERDPRLVKFARDNLDKAGLSKTIEVVLGDGSLGFPQGSKEEIYDRIVVTAAAPRVPVFLKQQLKTGGIIEAPIGRTQYQDLVKLKKKKARKGLAIHEFKESKIIECVFVPLMGEDAF